MCAPACEAIGDLGRHRQEDRDAVAGRRRALERLREPRHLVARARRRSARAGAVLAEPDGRDRAGGCAPSGGRSFRRSRSCRRPGRPGRLLAI